ncbi:MAG: GNAT family N-acetyltransferase [Dehalococcoidia bacterium]
MVDSKLIETERLTLRPLSLADAPAMQSLASDREVASGTMSMPHPYPAGEAERWIGMMLERERAAFAITLRSTDTFMGAIGLVHHPEQLYAEMGYWLGKSYWNQGYATEAVAAVLKYAFEELKLNRVYAGHFKRNPASGRVLEKIGMTYEGCLRQHVVKWGVLEDLVQYGILREEYQPQ